MADGELNRVVTAPNVLTIGRVLLLGVFCYLLLETTRQVGAAVVLMVAGASDFFDGYIARRFHQVSTIGKVIDPVADRIVIGTAVAVSLVAGTIPLWLGLVVIVREAVVSAGTVGLAALGARRINVIWAGKAGTFGLLSCLPLFVLGHGTASWERVLTDVTWVLVVPALALSLYATAAYVPIARRALADGHTAKNRLAVTQETA